MPNTPPGLSTWNAAWNTASRVAGLWLSQSCVLRKVNTMSAELSAPRFTWNGGANDGFCDVSVHRRIGLELGHEFRGRRRFGFDQTPVRIEERREDFGVPAAAGRQFDH